MSKQAKSAHIEASTEGLTRWGRPYKHLWMVEDRAEKNGREARSFWTRVGVAFENRDGSWSLELSAIPVDGRLQMRDPNPRGDTAVGNAVGEDSSVATGAAA